jgi:hypothetical protein
MATGGYLSQQWAGLCRMAGLRHTEGLRGSRAR